MELELEIGKSSNQNSILGSLNADTKKKMASRRCGRPKNIPEFARKASFLNV
jgi:hypothetical protein